MRLAIKFAYDGSFFFGYARQPSLKTVEGDIIRILQQKKIIEDVSSSVFRSASRTDKGVSSFGSVVAFNTALSKNDIIELLVDVDSSIFFYGVSEVDFDFNPPYANLRQYRYFLKKDDLDFKKIEGVASLFVGEHDFSNFARVEFGYDPVRSIDRIDLVEEGDFFVCDFFARTFLWHQIRRIISVFMKVGASKIDVSDVLVALDKPDLRVDFGVASALPLILMDIIYSFNFEVRQDILVRFDLFKQKFLDDLFMGL